MVPTLPDLLRHFARTTPAAPCVSFGQETLDFLALERRSNRVAALLQDHGVNPGDRVAFIARNLPEHYELFYGCARAGAILLPLNWRLSPGEVAQIINDAQPALILVADEFLPLLKETQTACPVIVSDREYVIMRDATSAAEQGRTIARDDVALILYTSGTTGQPKGVVLTHGNLALVERMAREKWGFSSASVNLVALPLFHIGGIGYGMMALSQGGHSVIVQQPSPEAVIASIHQHHITHLFLVPAVLQTLLDAPGVDTMDLTSVQRIMYGAAPITEQLVKRAIRVFGCQFNHAYGMTETAGTVITSEPADHDPGGPLAHRLRSCGRPVPWVELDLVDPTTGASVATGEVGEVCVRSPMIMAGYWQKPSETLAAKNADGWLKTGDAALMDVDGYVYLQDRYKDMIISGGENIYPTEIENVLNNLPGVSEVAVIGVPHDKWGETPCACIVPTGDAALTESAVVAFARDHLAHYKCPTKVVFVRSLPRTAAGKVMKRAMRGEAWIKDHT